MLNFDVLLRAGDEVPGHGRRTGRTDMRAPVTTRRFTVDEYHRMAEAGILHQDDRVELIEGQVVEMTPIGARHVACVVRLTDLLAPLTDRGLSLSVQNPLVLAERSEPQPDLAVLRRRADPPRAWLPTHADVVLVIEVADTSLEHERDIKVPLYARAGIPELWLVDLVGDRIAVHRLPEPDGYRDVSIRTRGDTLDAIGIPDFELDAGEIIG